MNSMRARRDLFPTDFGLVTRMATVGLMTPLAVLAGLYGVVRLGPWQVIAVVSLALVVGSIVGVRERVAISSPARRLSVAEAPELHAAVERLCVLAVLAKPALVLDHQHMPNSWIE